MTFAKKGVTAIRRAIQRVVDLVWQQQSLVVFRILPGQMIPVSTQLQGATFASSFVSGTSIEDPGIRELPGNLRNELRSPQPDQRLHLVDGGGRVASWGFSVRPRQPWPLTEVHSTLEVEEGGVCLFGFETLPEFRGRRLYPALLSRILSERFEEGATSAYIWCVEENRASYVSIKRVGFDEIFTHRYRRILGIPFHSLRHH